MKEFSPGVMSTTHLKIGIGPDTKSMVIFCPKDKVRGLQDMCRKALQDGMLTVHECEKLLDKMVSVRPVTPHAAPRYRPIQRQMLAMKASWPFGVRVNSYQHGKGGPQKRHDWFEYFSKNPRTAFEAKGENNPHW